ncbi:MAG: R3H domain-containing nucleic acid-binding protein [Minisyncoccia bacterium]
MRRNKEIQNFLEDFFKKFFPDYKIEFNNLKLDNIISFNINIPIKDKIAQTDSNFIYNLQLILGKIIRKKFQEEIILDIDINNEKEKRIKYLTALVDELVRQALLTKKEKTTPYLNPQERKIVYNYLSQRNDVIIESQGFDPQKRIVIKPK